MARIVARSGVALATTALLFVAGNLVAQSASIKPGLWETEISVTTNMTLPPDAEARIAALPPEQQAMIRSRMGGGKPTTSTNKSCVAPNTTIDSLLNQQTQRNGPMQCTVSNRSISSSGGSFDTTCTGAGSTATAHVEFTRLDDEHATGKMHMTMNSTRNGKTMSGSSDSTLKYKYIGADCGDVKPMGAAAGTH
ncbi:MAG TPA: DUF3617 domain-containing protein [Acidobacteriaceae bacterium]|nr:DUF3617 domain-containing protein [Acidobacteriaceae bacterium]